MIWFFLCVGLLVAGYFIIRQIHRTDIQPETRAENPRHHHG